MNLLPNLAQIWTIGHTGWACFLKNMSAILNKERESSDNTRIGSEEVIPDSQSEKVSPAIEKDVITKKVQGEQIKEDREIASLESENGTPLQLRDSSVKKSDNIIQSASSLETDEEKSTSKKNREISINEKEISSLLPSENTLKDKNQIKKIKTLGTINQIDKVVIVATGNSWIQIRDDINNKMLLTRLMQAGDRYEVPDQEGLHLLTGNAGALEIFVDGSKVPSIGGDGVVRRKVVLDVVKLKKGTAVDR